MGLTIGLRSCKAREESEDHRHVKNNTGT